MRAMSLKALTAVVLVAAVAGCASKKTDDSAATTTTTTAPAAAPAQTAPVQDTTVAPQNIEIEAAPAPGSASITDADGFENNPANYTGDVRTRVIYFGFDRAEVPSAAYATLKAHAKVLAASSLVRVKLEGHADERGTPEYNVALAERRANAVKKFLVLNGARDSQIEVVSFGEEKPAELGHDELSWAKNRRVEIVYTAGKP
ncbi:MAG: peptidoglycan-associated lipoprotein Pal [Pseudomonadota bacterium]